MVCNCIWKNQHGLHAVDWEILPNKVRDNDARKTFADSVSSLFRELPECTADAEVE